MENQQLLVHHPVGNYPIFVGYKLLGQLPALFEHALDNCALITDSNVGPLYQTAFGFTPKTVVTLPPGEQHKKLTTIQMIYNGLLSAHLDRSSTIIALGGGVIGDMAGFVAATYLRGIPLIQCPTSLLAMVDASVGGKTGVDMPQGKNLVGAFKQPLAVVVDLQTLCTLPLPELRSGLAEVVKHALLSSPALWELLSRHDWEKEIFTPNSTPLQELIVSAIQIKQSVVEIDPFEKGVRAHLNLGHTFAHAIEHVSGYRIRHGEAVAMGLVAAATLAHQIEPNNDNLQPKIEQMLRHLSLPIRIPAALDADALLAAMSHDKKNIAQTIRFILLRKMGQPYIAQPPIAAVKSVLKQLQQA